MPNQLRDALKAVGYDMLTTHEGITIPHRTTKDVLTDKQKDGLRALRDEYRVALVTWTLNPHNYASFMVRHGIDECNRWLTLIDEELPPCDEKENVS